MSPNLKRGENARSTNSVPKCPSQKDEFEAAVSTIIEVFIDLSFEHASKSRRAKAVGRKTSLKALIANETKARGRDRDA